MRDDVRRALAIGPDATIEERTIDVTTTGRRSGQPRRIEICFETTRIYTRPTSEDRARAVDLLPVDQ